MKEITFIDNWEYILFLPNIYWKIILSYGKFKISRNGFIGRLLKKVYKSYFSNSYSVFEEYIKYYRKEFNTYKDFLDSHYNLTEIELRNFNSLGLRCSKECWFNSHNYILDIKSIREKLENYLGGKFYTYES